MVTGEIESCVIEHYSVLSNIPVTSYTMLYATKYM